MTPSTVITWAIRPRTSLQSGAINREDMDKFAVGSQNKAEAAQKAGRFKDESVAFTVPGKKGDTVVDKNEYIRAGATLEAMAKLRPAFSKEGGVTAAMRPASTTGPASSF